MHDYIMSLIFYIFITISLLTSPLLGHRPFGLHIRRTGHNPPSGPSANDCKCSRNQRLNMLSKHGGARDNKFLVIHPKTHQRCLTSAIARQSALNVGPSSASMLIWNIHLKKTIKNTFCFSHSERIEISNRIIPPIRSSKASSIKLINIHVHVLENIEPVH
jgi:hypothetical protein